MTTTVHFYLVRHGPTSWNELGRIQGHTDIPLSSKGITEVQRWRWPADIKVSRTFVSPLRRTRETARLLQLPRCHTEAALIEMSWGDWEGARLIDLRERLGDDIKQNESRGLGFRPPNGECPQQVVQRTTDWMGSLSGNPQHNAVVTHKGVIRALVAHALGWDMIGKSPIKLRWDAVHHLSLELATKTDKSTDTQGNNDHNQQSRPRLQLVQANIPLLA